MKKRCNNTGLSLLELVIGTLLAGMLSFVMMSFGRMTYKTQSVLEEQLSAIEDDALNYRIMHDDLSRAGASFDVLTRTGENGNFFDMSTGGSCTVCTRRVTLVSAPGTSDTNAIHFLIDELKITAGVSSINPLAYYDSVSGTATGALQINYSKLEVGLKDLRPGQDLSRDGRLLMFYSPERVLSSFSGSQKMMSFLTVARKSGSWTLSPPAVVGRQLIPSTGVEMTNVDMFFRNMPGIGGNGFLAMVKPMKLVRYQISPSFHKGFATSRLIRSEYNGSLGQFPNCASTVLATGCLVIGKHVKSLEFLRNETASPVIDYRLSVERFEFDTKESL